MKIKLAIIVLIISLGQCVKAQNNNLTQKQRDSIALREELRRRFYEKFEPQIQQDQIDSIETMDQLKKAVYDKFQPQKVEMVENDLHAAHIKRVKDDSIVKANRQSDSITCVEVLKNISENKKLIVQLKNGKRLTKKEQEKIMKLFLIVLDCYKSYVVAYDKEIQDETEIAYNINASLEGIQKKNNEMIRLINKNEKLTEENEALIEKNDELIEENATLKMKLKKIHK